MRRSMQLGYLTLYFFIFCQRIYIFTLGMTEMKQWMTLLYIVILVPCPTSLFIIFVSGSGANCNTNYTFRSCPRGNFPTVGRSGIFDLTGSVGSEGERMYLSLSLYVWVVTGWHGWAGPRSTDRDTWWPISESRASHNIHNIMMWGGGGGGVPVHPAPQVCFLD